MDCRLPNRWGGLALERRFKSSSDLKAGITSDDPEEFFGDVDRLVADRHIGGGVEIGPKWVKSSQPLPAVGNT